MLYVGGLYRSVTLSGLVENDMWIPCPQPVVTGELSTSQTSYHRWWIAWACILAVAKMVFKENRSATSIEASEIVNVTFDISIISSI